MDFLRSLYEQAKAFWQGLSPGRRVGLPLVVLAVIGFLVYATAVLNQPKFAPLFTGLSPADAGEITAKLKESGVRYRLAEKGTAVLVPQEQVYETRINLASQGLPKGGVVGFELFNETRLGTTDFERKLKYNWALQGELTRTIREMSEVEDARVHIVLPERSLFVSEDREPTASVLLKLRPGRRLSEGQIYGIANLLAGSVEGLKPENVTILDSTGNILSDALAAGPVGAGISGRGIMAQLQLKREVEKELQRELQTMLEPLFGFGKVVARVNAELNFDYKEQNSENFTPVNTETGTGIIRSRAVRSESYQSSGGAGGVPGVSGNIPGYQAVENGGSSQYEKTDTTENYELNRVQEKLIVAPGQVKRLSVAVWVDGKLSQAQLASVRQAVAGAVGFNEQRGDQLFIDSMKFESQDLKGEAPAEKPAGRTNLVWAAVAAAVVLGVGVAAVTRRRKVAQQVAEERKGRALDVLIAEKQAEVQPLAVEALSAEDQERLNKEKQVRKLADEKPEEFAGLLKTWLTEDER
ncbi:MAG: flagellar basal-body MS-ring/collar protein FliF [Bacillota bacterium]|nr:flagellar basal-body MS-ring/collar protein FliF [Bacillota bacterium]